METASGEKESNTIASEETKLRVRGEREACSWQPDEAKENKTPAAGELLRRAVFLLP